MKRQQAFSNIEYGGRKRVSRPRREAQIEYRKSKVRSKVEHTFYIIKHLFAQRNFQIILQKLYNATVLPSLKYLPQNAFAELRK